MAEETIQVIKIDTEWSVRNVRELREDIKNLKEALDDEDASLEQNRKAAEDLRKAQAALRDVMYSTVTSTDDLIASSQKLVDENGVLTGSYNDLVKTMASLKSAWRATTDEAERAKLGPEIDKLNNKLKELDAGVGVYGRNVGNYGSALNGLADILNQMPPTLGAVGGQIKNVGAAMKLVSTNPLLGIVGLLAPIISKIAEGLKGNATAVGAVNKAMKALEPVFNFFSKVLETIAGWISKAVDWMVELASRSTDTFKKIVAGAVGVGNSLLQFLLTPIRSIIEAAKGLGQIMKDVFTGQFKKVKEDAKNALGGIADAFKKGFDFKGNFAAGKEAGEAFVAGLGSTKKKAKETGKGIAKDVKDGFLEELATMNDEIDKELEKILDETLKDIEEATKKAAAKEAARLAALEKGTARALELNEIEAEDAAEKEAKKYEIQKAANERRLALLEQFRSDALNRGDLDLALQYEQEAADLEVDIERNAMREKKRLREKDVADAKEKAAAQLTLMQSYAGGVSDVLGTLADIMESNGDESDKAANRVKALRIAAATIDTISGAIGAYMQSVQSIPSPAGAIVGAIQAAAVTAAGVANIAKMRATKVGSGGTSAAASPVAVEAPALQTSVQQVRNVTSASEEDRLNKMASDQRVYIVNSDIEASLGQSRVQVAEASF